MQTLDEFVQANLGKANVGDTPENKGQCVGLIEVWLDNLHLPHVWGNAVDLLKNAPVASYGVYHNQAGNYPLAGDIVVWDATWGAGAGHTGVVLYASSMQLVVFEQNDPTGSPCIVATHGYTGVAGWLRPK